MAQIDVTGVGTADEMSADTVGMLKALAALRDCDMITYEEFECLSDEVMQMDKE